MSPHPILTVGTFDGVHLGHQALLKRVMAIAKQEGLPAEIVTFEMPPAPFKALIMSLEHKLHLLSQFNPNKITPLPFTSQWAAQSAEDFIRRFQPHTLVIGKEARLGKDQHGDRAHLKTLSSQLHFHLDVVPSLSFEGAPISSSRIRQAIAKGELKEVAALLGRPYSIRAPIVPGQGLARKLGFPTLNLAVEGLVLPPFGVWAVQVGPACAVANLGVAPMFQRPGPPLLEVHLIDPIDIHSPMEVVFKKYLREEKVFATVEALQTQIQRDIDEVRYLN